MGDHGVLALAFYDHEIGEWINDEPHAWIIEEIRTDELVPGEDKSMYKPGETLRWPGPSSHKHCSDRRCDCHTMHPMTLDQALQYSRTEEPNRYWNVQLRNLLTNEIIPLTPLLDV